MFKDVSLKNGNIEENIKSIKTSIKNILSTKIGSVPGNPAFGSNLNQFVFSLIGPLEKELIKEEIVNVLELWEDRFKIENIEVTDNPDYNQVFIEITFSVIIKNEKILETTKITIDK